MKFPILNPLSDIVLCSRENCSRCVKADDAVWDEDFELPYCSPSCLTIDKQSQAARNLEFEDEDNINGYVELEDYLFDDPRSEGYVSPEDAQENYLLTVEAYDVYSDR